MPVIALGIVLMLLAREMIAGSENVRWIVEWQLKGIILFLTLKGLKIWLGSEPSTQVQIERCKFDLTGLDVTVSF